jgi:hypothetical protein
MSPLMGRKVWCLAALLILSACNSASPTAQRPTTTVTAKETPPKVVQAVARVQLTTNSEVAGFAFDAKFNVSSLRIGKAVSNDVDPANRLYAAAIVFPRFDVAGACLSRVNLTLPTATATSGTEVAVYASAALSLASAQAPPAGSGGAGTLLDNRPRALESFKAGITDATFDVTAIARLWADGSGFPSNGRSVPRGSPFIVVTRPPGFDAGVYSLTTDAIPELRIIERAGC